MGVSPTYRISLCDRQNNELADLTPLASNIQRQRWHGPTFQSWAFRLPAIHSDVYTVHSDGYRYVAKLARAVKVYRTPGGGGSETIVANMLVIKAHWKGDKDGAWVDVTCADPMWWWKRRPTRDDAGRFALPIFSSPITAPEMLKTAVDQSISADGTLGLNTTDGTFETSGPDFGDYKVDNWPRLLSEFAAELSATGVCDVRITPVDTSDGYGTEDGLAIMGILNAYVDAGTDRSASVNFDYGTGDFSLDAFEYVDDGDTICNKLYYYLGPRVPGTDRRYQGNITPPANAAYFNHSGSGGPDLRDSALETARGTSITDFGTFFDIDIYDDSGAENATRTLFEKLWMTELRLRVNGQTLVKATPSFACDFQAYEHWNPGDIVALNSAASAIGIDLSSAPVRLYGEQAAIDANGVEQPGELILSADQEG